MQPQRPVVRRSPLSGSLTLSIFALTASILVGCPAARQDSESTAIRPPQKSSLKTGPDGVESMTDEQQRALLVRIDAVLDANRQQRLLATDAQGAWQILHGILAYAHDFPILTSAGETSAVDYILAGGAVKGFELRLGDKFSDSADVAEGNAADSSSQSNRGIRSLLDPGTKLGEGHRDQWLAYLTACNLKPDQQIQTLDGPSTVRMWLRQMEWDVPLNFEREYSWTLMSLVPFFSTDHAWTARDTKRYSIQSLLQSELDMLSPQSACGGSHRMTAIAITLQKRLQEGLPLTSGTWTDAQFLVETAMEEAFAMQNSDGSFSSHYFERGGWTRELVTAIGTTGHVLEFIAVAAPQDLLQTQACGAAANRLCEMLEQSSAFDLECGALYHALSGLQIYRKRLNEAD